MPLHVVNEVNRLLREYKRNGLDIQDKQIKKHIDDKFNISVSLTSIGRIRRGERRKEQSDTFNMEQDDDEDGE